MGYCVVGVSTAVVAVDFLKQNASGLDNFQKARLGIGPVQDIDPEGQIALAARARARARSRPFRTLVKDVRSSVVINKQSGVRS